MSLPDLEEIEEGDRCYVFGCTGHMVARRVPGAHLIGEDTGPWLRCDRCGEEIRKDDT